MTQRNFDTLQGETLTKIVGLREGETTVEFQTSSGRKFSMSHWQDCCENVEITEVIGNADDLIGQEILLAEKVTHENKNPEGVKAPEYQDCFEWTFYKLRTMDADVTIRWHGDSNGYYSTSVDFEELDSAKGNTDGKSSV